MTNTCVTTQTSLKCLVRTNLIISRGTGRSWIVTAIIPIVGPIIFPHPRIMNLATFRFDKPFGVFVIQWHHELSLSQRVNDPTLEQEPLFNHWWDRAFT